MLFREDCTADELIDVIIGKRVYLPCLYVYNKIDQISIQEVDRIARQPNSVVVRWGKLCEYRKRYIIKLLNKKLRPVVAQGHKV